MKSLPAVAQFVSKARLGTSADLVDVVEAIRSIPYGRPADCSAAGVVSEWRGTCSTKHALLLELISARWPDLGLRVVHRVYRLTPAIAPFVLRGPGGLRTRTKV
jgi:hypothetical protein